MNRHPVPPGRLEWLEREATRWVDEGLVSREAAGAITGQYVASASERTLSLARLLSYLGGAFVGVGLIWLVATNLDQLSPLVRFVGITAIWLAVTAAAEIVKGPGALRGALRAISAMAFGAVVFQAAQSLQVPAYEPALLGFWGAGAVVYAYACGGVAPLVVGVATTSTWFVWQVVDAAAGTLPGVASVLVGAVAAVAVAAAHERFRPAFSQVWRLAGASLILGGLFVAALPGIGDGDLAWTATLIAGAVAAVGLVVFGALTTRGLTRWEVLASVLVVPVGVALVVWDPRVQSPDEVSGAAWASAIVSIAVYLVAAGAVAVIGSLRGATLLVVLATGALVVFTTVQSFAVFAPIMSGAVLFLVLGVVLVASGVGFDRARRGLAANLKESLS